MWKELVVQFPQEADYRNGVANTLVAMGDHAGAAREAGTSAKLAPGHFQSYSQAAALLSLCVSAAATDVNLPEAKRQELSQTYLRQALAFLRDAIAKGYRNADELENDADFEPLRAHAEFKKLVTELKEKQKK